MNLVVNIEKRLRDFTLRANFTLTDTTLALLGASGSGKSMTLKCIAGLETPDRGQIVLNGRTLYDSSAGVNLPPQERSVGYLFQNYALFPNMTVRENIIFALDGSREEKERILAENVARFSLEGLEDARPSALSGGQQQRVAFARILARGADVLLLDEPTDHLDMESITALNNGLIKFPGVLLFSSRDHQIVETTANRIMEIINGKLVDKITTYDAYLDSDEMARKRFTYTVSADDESDD